MTYEQALEYNPTISHAQALQEIKEHFASVTEFYEDCGKKEHYKARTVLYWLGY